MAASCPKRVDRRSRRCRHGDKSPLAVAGEQVRSDAKRGVAADHDQSGAASGGKQAEAGFDLTVGDAPGPARRLPFVDSMNDDLSIDASGNHEVAL